MTIDGVDLSAWVNQAVLSTSSPTFVALTLSGALTSTSSAAFTTITASGNITGGALLTINGVGPHVFSAAATNVLHLRNTASGLTERAYVQVTAGTSAVYLQALSQGYTSAGDLQQAGGSLESIGAGGLSLAAIDSAGAVRFYSGAVTTPRMTLTSTGHLSLIQYTETNLAPTIAAGVLTLNLATATHFSVLLNANITTVTITNPAPVNAASFTIRFTADGTVRTITWPASVKWPNGVAPTMTGTVLKKDLISCITYDAGIEWLCAVGGQNW